jgi:hypothetical protein
MKKRILVCAMSALLLAITSWADDEEKDEDRLKNAGTVLTERAARISPGWPVKPTIQAMD